MPRPRIRSAPEESHRESHRPRKWLSTFAEPGVLLDAYRAARSCMSAACDDDPDTCGHPVNLMTPLEFVAWIEDELNVARRNGATFGAVEQPAMASVRPLLRIVSV